MLVFRQYHVLSSNYPGYAFLSLRLSVLVASPRRYNAALQNATTLVMVIQLNCVELLPAKAPTAMNACVRTHIVRMVAFFAAGFAH